MWTRIFGPNQCPPDSIHFQQPVIWTPLWGEFNAASEARKKPYARGYVLMERAHTEVQRERPANSLAILLHKPGPKPGCRLQDHSEGNFSLQWFLPSKSVLIKVSLPSWELASRAFVECNALYRGVFWLLLGRSGSNILVDVALFLSPRFATVRSLLTLTLIPALCTAWHWIASRQAIPAFSNLKEKDMLRWN